MDFASHDALMDRLRQDMKDVTRVAANWMTDKVQESIQQNVYNAWVWDSDHPRVYQRTYQFLNSWEALNTSQNQNESVYWIYSNPSRMDWNPMMYQHGNDYIDRTDEMDENIQEGKNYDFASGAGQGDEPNPALARDYWTDVEEYIDQDVLDLKFSWGFTKLGLKFV